MVMIKGTVVSRMVDSPNETWTNVYNISDANPVSALTTLNNIAVAQANVMYSLAEVFLLRTRQPHVPPGVEKEVSLVGQVDPGTGTFLPQWNVARVDFLTPGERPDIKYLRLPLLTSSVTGLNLTNGVVTELTTAYADALMAIPNFVSAKGSAFTGFAVHPLVQMRQLGWHRRFRPGFHRGWVPDA